MFAHFTGKISAEFSSIRKKATGTECGLSPISLRYDFSIRGMLTG
jgi:hypothetical protein